MCGPLQQRVGPGKTGIGPLSPFRPFIGFYIEVASFSLRYFPRGGPPQPTTQDPPPSPHPKHINRYFCQLLFSAHSRLLIQVDAEKVKNLTEVLIKGGLKYITGPSNTSQGLQIHCRAFKYIAGPPNTSQGLQTQRRLKQIHNLYWKDPFHPSSPF